MDHNSKKYARKVLLAHLLALVVLLAAVGFGAWRIYRQARQQAIEQAGVRQELFAAQTAKGIESFYYSIIDDLSLWGRTETTHAAASALQSQTPPLRHDNAVESLLWNQMGDRVAALFIYDRQAGDPDHAFEVLEPSTSQLPPVSAHRLRDDIRVLCVSVQQWLGQLEHPGVSRLLPLAPDSPLQHVGAGGVNLVCVPLGGRWQLIAVVPAAAAQMQFLTGVNERRISSATLMDDNLAVIASTSPELAGTNLNEIHDPIVLQLTADFAADPTQKTEPLDAPVVIDTTQTVLPPRLLTIQPVSLPQVNWALLISSPMKDVDAIVQDMFRVVIVWAGFLVVSMTAILVSTTFQLIRIRLRMERLTHDVLTRELSQARQIQLNWLPDRVAAGTALDLAAVNHPANHISGDFYNWFNLPDGRWVIIIGDVSGHGMAAAFLMATTQLLVRTTMPRIIDPGLCMEEVNRQLCTQVFHGQFVTMLIMVLDLEQGILDAVSAGQSAPLLREADGPFIELPLTSNVVLAVDQDQKYPTERFKLGPQSTIVLYTDGVVEVKNEKDEWFDVKGLIGALKDFKGSSQAVIERVVVAVDEFRGEQDLSDDLTLVVVQAEPIAARQATAVAPAKEAEAEEDRAVPVTPEGA